MTYSRFMLTVVTAVVVSMAFFACDREERGFRVQPPAATTVTTVVTSDLHPGTTRPATIPAKLASSTQPTTSPSTQASSTRPTTRASTTQAVVDQFSTRPAIALPLASASRAKPIKNRYEENAYHLTEGKRLYMAYNCVGCHANGGGGMGPPLMDDKWVYGSNPEHVFATIVQGRPNGVPSFMGRIPDYQVWQIAAYVRSMSGLVPKDAATGRSDHMQVKKPENSTDPEQPKNTVVPKSAEMPQ
jgi:cytochrome c oxidase cbb3-type subunit III